MPLKCTRTRRPLALPAPAIRLHKAAQAKIPKHHRNQRPSQKPHMILMVHGRRMHRPAQPPRRPARSHRKQPKKYPRQLQPKHPRQLHQWLSHRRPKSPAAFLQSLPGLLHLSRCACHPVAQSRPRIRNRSPTPVRLSRRRRGAAAEGLGAVAASIAAFAIFAASRVPIPSTRPKTNRIHRPSVSFPPNP